jgi:hypothetical protein
MADFNKVLMSPNGNATIPGVMTAASFKRAAPLLQQSFPISLADARTTGTFQPLGAAAGTPSGACGITAGTFGTTCPIIVSEAGSSKSDAFRFILNIPHNYSPGGALNLVFSISETATFDGTIAVSGYLVQPATLGSDLIALAAVIPTGLSATFANYSVPFTALTGIVPGSEIDIQVTLATVTTATMKVQSITLLADCAA